MENQINIGEKFKFGRYKWRVLDVQEDKVLLIADKTLFLCYYHDTDRQDITWESCDLRKCLNTEILEDEKYLKEIAEHIIETQIVNAGNLWFGTEGGNDTLDKVFLLSLEEVDRYFGGSGDYLNKRRLSIQGNNSKPVFSEYENGRFLHNEYDKLRMVITNYKDSWWLRSPGKTGSKAAFVENDGYVDVGGWEANTYDVKRTMYMYKNYSRPAFWLKKSVIIELKEHLNNLAKSAEQERLIAEQKRLAIPEWKEPETILSEEELKQKEIPYLSKDGYVFYNADRGIIRARCDGKEAIMLYYNDWGYGFGHKITEIKDGYVYFEITGSYTYQASDPMYEAVYKEYNFRVKADESRELQCISERDDYQMFGDDFFTSGTTYVHDIPKDWKNPAKQR